jgi:3-methyladenine DNA glycosylase AlkC
MALIKDIYCSSFYTRFADVLQEVIPSLDKKQFILRMMGDDFAHMEWKGRMKRTTVVFHEFMPDHFAAAMKLIEKLIIKLRASGVGDDGLAFIFLPDYIETYGLDAFADAVKAFELVTQFVSCEFAVRPFILKYGQRMIDEMVVWSTHESPKVRRLATEGSRPRLPWAMAIPALKKDPSPILPILENLKNDPSESVRRSVANNLNDISKDHPAVVIAIAAKWKGVTKETDSLIKHGCRTLLKQGHVEVLNHYGLESKNIAVDELQVLTPEVKIGDSLEFSFKLINQNSGQHTIRLEYGIYYQKANGLQARKVFKISEKVYQPNDVVQIQRKQSFKLITTRKFHTGAHQISIIVNGEEKQFKAFELIA